MDVEAVIAAADADARGQMHERMVNNLRESMPITLARKIDQYQNRLAGQRRDITVLCVDLCGLGTAAQRIGSEEAFILTDRVTRLLADTIYKYEGVIDRFTGDNLMALFGLPVNHENDPERAVRTALEIQESIRLHQEIYQAEFGVKVSVKIGINTGVVIAGNLASQRHMDYTVVGDTVNLANRLQAAADPGMTLVSFRAYQRTRPIFDYQVLSPLELSAYQFPVYVFQPVRVRAIPGQTRGLPGLQAPMIGREADFNQLVENLNAVREGKGGRVVFINGNAGIGKTRLVAEFRNALEGKPVNFYLGNCASYMRITPFRVIADILRNILHLSEMEPAQSQQEALYQYLKQLDLETSDLFDYLASVLGIAQQDPVSEVRLKLLDPVMLQRQVHTALRAFLLAKAQNAVTVLIFDDLHWVDPASLSFLDYFSHSLGDAPVMMILIARDFERDQETEQLVKNAWKAVVNPVRIYLKPLSSKDSRLLLDQLIPAGTAELNEIKDRIIQRAGGSPYYTEELVRVLIDHEGLVCENSHWVMTSKAREMIEEVPGTLQDIFLARFDRLRPQLQTLLQRCSALRSTIYLDLIQRLYNKNDDALQYDLNELEKRDFLTCSHFGQRETYFFRHPLLQETIYKTMLSRSSRELHLQIAQILEEGGSWLSGDPNEILAYHFTESTSPAKAVPYLMKAAATAEQHFANEVVIQHYRRALELMEHAPAPANDDIQKAKIGLGKALKFTGNFEEAVRIIGTSIADLMDVEEQPETDLERLSILLTGMREMADIRAREGKLDLSVELLQKALDLVQPEHHQHFSAAYRQILDRLAWVYFRQGRLEEAFQIADLALLDEHLWEVEDPITLASLNNTIGGILYMRSRPRDAVEYVDRGLRIYKSLNYHWGMAIAYTNLGVLKHAQGKWADAVDSFEQADEIRIEHGYTPERPVNLKNIGEVLMCMGDHARAREKLLTSLEISHRLSADIFTVYAEIGLSRLALIEKDLSGAADHLRSARALLDVEADDADDRVIQLLNLEATLEMEQDHHQEACRLAQQAQRLAGSGGFLSEKIEALRITGMACTHLKDFEQAEISLRKSIEQAHGQGDSYHQAQALHELGCMYAVQAAECGPEDAERHKALLDLARGTLNDAVDLFSLLGAKYDLMISQAARNSIPVGGRLELDREGLDDAQKQVSQLRSALGIPEGEWFQAAVLHVSLMPESGVDEEFIFETISLLVPSFVEIFQEYGGEVLLQQESLTVIFGMPVARESDTERAVEAAIQANNFYQDLYNQTQMPLTLRMGMASGKIVAGVNEALQGGLIAAGEPLLEARKLAEAATPSHIWVTQSVRNSTAFRFNYAPVPTEYGAQPGITHPMQLEGLRDQILPVRGLIGLRSPFIGRRAELSSMQAMIDNLPHGKGGLIFLEGEPGIGKSRLMREFAELSELKNALIWQGACYPRRADQAFSLVSDIIAQSFDLQPNAPPEQIYKVITQIFMEWPLELAEVRPFIEVLAGVRPSGEEGERLLALEPEQFRRQTFVALRKIFVTLAHQRPLVLLMDDLQWIDPVSADLFLFLSRLILDNPVLLVGTLRNTEDSSMNNTMDRIRQMCPGQILQVSVYPLTPEESRSLLEAFLSSTNLPIAVHDLIVRQSGGNPYFIEEFVRMLIEQDYLRLNRGKMEVNQYFEINALTIPTSLENLIRARVDSLPPSTRKLLQVASVIGKTFTAPLLVTISEQNNLERHFELLQARGMLKCTEQDRWEFTHELIETIVYNTILKAHRQLLHQRAAFALEAFWQGNEVEHADDLAYHFRRAGENVKTLYYLALAGERAAARYANEAALSHFKEAASLLNLLPETSDQLRWRIACGLGEVNQFTGNFESSIAALNEGLRRIGSQDLTRAQKAGVYRRIGETYLKAGDYENAFHSFDGALALLEPPETPLEKAEAARALLRKGWGHAMQSRLDAAREIIGSAWSVASQAENVSVMAMAENMLGGVFFRQGAFKEAVHHTQEAIAGWEKMGYSWGVAAALSNLGVLEAVAGNWVEAERFFTRALMLRQEMGDVEGVAILMNNLAQLTRDQGNLDQAETHCRNSLAIARPFQLMYHIAVSTACLSQVLLQKGLLPEAQDLIEQGVKLSEEIDARDMYCELRRTQAEIYLACGGEAEKAYAEAQSACEEAEKIGDPALLASCWRVVSQALLAQKKLEEARQALEKALEAVSGDASTLEAGRVFAYACLLFARAGDAEQSCAYRMKAEEIFSRLGAARDLQRLQRP